MSIELLFDHHADQYRQLPPEDARTRDPLGNVLVFWEPVIAPVGDNCRPDQIWSGVLQDSGPGEQQAGRRRWFLDKSFEVAERDVLDVVTGTAAPVRLRILSVTPQNTRNGVLHHIEVNVEVWQGTLTLAGEES